MFELRDLGQVGELKSEVILHIFTKLGEHVGAQWGEWQRPPGSSWPDSEQRPLVRQGAQDCLRGGGKL